MSKKPVVQSFFGGTQFLVDGEWFDSIEGVDWDNYCTGSKARTLKNRRHVNKISGTNKMTCMLCGLDQFWSDIGTKKETK